MKLIWSIAVVCSTLLVAPPASANHAPDSLSVTRELGFTEAWGYPSAVNSVNEKEIAAAGDLLPEASASSRLGVLWNATEPYPPNTAQDTPTAGAPAMTQQRCDSLAQTLGWADHEYAAEIGASTGHCYNWSSSDWALERMTTASASMTPLLQVVAAPSWSRPSAATCAGCSAYPPDSAYLGDWRIFVRNVIERYVVEGTTPVKGLEVWNEPNFWPFWGGAADSGEYAEVYRKAKQARDDLGLDGTDIALVLGGLLDRQASAPGCTSQCSAKDETFLRDLYGDLAKSSFDGIGSHPYGSFQSCGVSTGVGSMWGHIDNLNSIRDQFNDNQKPIYITEVGHASSCGGEADQADRMIAMYNSIYGHRIPVILFYRFRQQANDGSPFTTTGSVLESLDAQGNLVPKLAYCDMADRLGTSPSLC